MRFTTQRFLMLLSIGLVVTAIVMPRAPAQDIPLVYSSENTGTEFSDPPLPEIAELPTVRALPDPFEWSDRRGRSTSFSDWSRRRSEIQSEIEHFEIGNKPPRPQLISASYADGLLKVEVTENGQTLSLTAKIELPDGEGPFPAVIGIGQGSGSLPRDILASRNIATIAFNFSQVMSHTQLRGNEPINRLYPDQVSMGAYCAWPWGISRIIDGLELVKDDLPIDLQHLAVTGCSFAGKMALFAGALDERIALTIAQESGGGGAAAWRVSETLGNVETLGKTNHAWFLEDMFQFAGAVEKLPYDHHELMALVAPRALLVLGNPDYEWLADESGYVSCRAAHEVWKAFGIADRFGFSIVAGHPHCQLPNEQRPEVEAFVDKFLLGKANVNTSITKHPFDHVEHELWYDGWTTGTSSFPTADSKNLETLNFEVESTAYGSDWQVISDPEASGGKYLTIRPGLNSPKAAPSDKSGAITIPFETTQAKKYYVFARANCPSADDDSFWIKVDDNHFSAANGLGTNGWEWVKLTVVALKPGMHTLTMAYREDGAHLDRIAITTYPFGPTGLPGVDDSDAESVSSSMDRRSLKDAVGSRFKVGVGVGHRVLENSDDAALIRQHFEILTPENCMKPQGIHPAEDRWRFEATDRFADFVRKNNLEMVGHCLVWAKDDRTDPWMMSEGDLPVSREKLLQRIELHVKTVVDRYADVATHWDVVNEAIGDGQDGLLRDSVYSRTAGMDFIVTAFKTARASDPEALLIYNDYNGHKPGKRKKLIELLTKLKAAGAPVDAYGMQGHFELGDNSLSELRETFDELRKLNIKIVVSELDIDVVKRGQWWADDGAHREELASFDPYQDGMPPEVETQMVDQYVKLFELFDDYSDIIARVSFWNLHDGQSWLNYFPWQRVNHPLLFDRDRNPKPAFDAVYQLLTKEKLAPSGNNGNATSHTPWQRNDANSQAVHKQLVAKTQQGKVDVYFQGDSITRRWGATDYPELLQHWNETFYGWNAANFAWGGDSTHHMLWRMQNGELEGVSPKVVCLQAGANNLPWTGPATDSHVDDVVDGIQAIVAEFRKRFPEVPIVLTAMFPRDQNAELSETIAAINHRLKAFSDDDARIHWININWELLGPDGKLRPDVSTDGIHLEKAGYVVWGKALRPVLEQLLGSPAASDQAPPPTGNPGL
ncbi:Endo-1,4-beta-xylanase A precursor [Rubripirellula amarantea]|uniref:Beta-xylanase n=1 Tax=Rubripirellula amarantea TaxID=2527999 RepID=A0A5C5WX78_9BACT|nr:endo-1,4-beta-xylanase [Rubripirellula amarantea]TWT54859.1 Endo-1,4-beta-xylanase A precursor [Rubripirellula amarantea]